MNVRKKVHTDRSIAEKLIENKEPVEIRKEWPQTRDTCVPVTVWGFLVQGSRES